MTLELSPDHAEVVSLLHPLDAGLEPAIASLHARLARDAQLTHTLDVAYRIVDSPLGNLLLAATDRGIVRVAFELEDHDSVLQFLANTVSPRILQAPARLDDAARELEEYFSGTRKEFDLTLDFRLCRGFRLNVLRHLPRIPYGSTASYAQVAQAAGSPNAVRAVGTACATNPLPLIVPCHRVVKSDGSFGGYLGGSEAKRALLHLEAAA